MGQTAFAEYCQSCCSCCSGCCCCKTTETEITNEIKSRPIKNKRKPKPKVNPNTRAVRAPLLKQSLSDSNNIAFAKLEDTHPSDSDHGYPDGESKEAINTQYNQKLNPLSNTVSRGTQTFTYVSRATQTESFEKTHSIFIQMDHAIGEYYKHNGINNYYTNNGTHSTEGKFLKYIITNNYNPNDIESQFSDNINPKDCIYTHFDYDSFPINKNNNISKDEQIFNVLQHCYKYGDAPIINTINIQTTETQLETDTHAPVDTLDMIQYDNNTDDEDSKSLSDSVKTEILHDGSNDIQTYEEYASDQENNSIPKANNVGLYDEYDKKEQEYDANETEISNDINQVSDSHIKAKTTTSKIVIEQMNNLSTLTGQSVDSYIKESDQPNTNTSDGNANDVSETKETSETRKRGKSHKILIEPPLSTLSAESADSYMTKNGHDGSQSQGDYKEKMDVHARYEREMYEKEIGKLDTGMWERDDDGDVTTGHGPDKVLKEDTSWVSTKRRVSYHAPHESIAKLKSFKKVVSNGKLFEAWLTPIDDEESQWKGQNLLSRNKRAYSMPPVKQ